MLHTKARRVVPCTADAFIGRMDAHLSAYGSRRYCYGYPLLPEIDRPPEYWCLDEIRIALKEASGVDVIARDVPEPAWVPSAYEAFAAAPASLYRTVPMSEVRAGDLEIFGRGGSYYHIGAVRGPFDGTGWLSIEGDGSSDAFPGSQFTGGVMVKKKRYASQYAGTGWSVRFWRPGFLPALPQAPITGHYPLPAGQWFGPDDHTSDSHSGIRAGDARYVRHIQHLVGATADGIYGPHTQAAVAAWQRRHHLTPDGITGPRTWAQLTKEHA